MYNFTYFFNLKFKKDLVVWNRKSSPEQPQFVKEDTPIKRFRRYYSQFYTGNKTIENNNQKF